MPATIKLLEKVFFTGILSNTCVNIISILPFQRRIKSQRGSSDLRRRGGRLLREFGMLSLHGRAGRRVEFTRFVKVIEHAELFSAVVSIKIYRDETVVFVSVPWPRCQTLRWFCDKQNVGLRWRISSLSMSLCRGGTCLLIHQTLMLSLLPQMRFCTELEFGNRCDGGGQVRSERDSQVTALNWIEVGNWAATLSLMA